MSQNLSPPLIKCLPRILVVFLSETPECALCSGYADQISSEGISKFSECLLVDVTSKIFVFWREHNSLVTPAT